MKSNFFENNADYFYVAFRVIIGIIFLLHGIMKISSISSGNLELMSLMGLAMIIETLGGIFLIIGLFTRTVAGISALEMLYAYGMVHVKSGGLNPLGNNGEPAALFFAAFLVLLAFGARKCAIDSIISRR